MEKFIIKHYADTPHPIIKGNGFDGTVIGDFRDEAEDFINFVNELVEHRNSHTNDENSNSAELACPKCGKTDKTSIYCDHCVDIHAVANSLPCGKTNKAMEKLLCDIQTLSEQSGFDDEQRLINTKAYIHAAWAQLPQ